jgi:hypothetical protein
MRFIPLLPVAHALIVSLPVAAADQATALVDRVVPAYGVHYDQPLRMPSRIDPQISQARAYLTQLNAKMLGAGAGADDLAAISTWQGELAKLANELIPGISAYERQQLNAIFDDLDRAGESIALLTAHVAPAAPKFEANPYFAPAARAPGIRAHVPVVAPAVAVSSAVGAANSGAAPEATMEVPARVPAVAMPVDVQDAAPVDLTTGEVPDAVPAAAVPAVEPVAPAFDAAPVVDATAPIPALDGIAPPREEAAPVVDAVAPTAP